MKTLASVILFLLLAAPALADDSPAPQALPNTARQCGAKDQPRGDLPDILEAGRGCCSRHGQMPKEIPIAILTSWKCHTITTF